MPHKSPEEDIAGPFVLDSADIDRWREAMRRPMDPAKGYVSEVPLDPPRVDAQGSSHFGLMVTYPVASDGGAFLVDRVKLMVAGRGVTIILANSKTGREVAIGGLRHPLHEMPPKPRPYAQRFAPDGRRFELVDDGTEREILQRFTMVLEPLEEATIEMKNGETKVTRSGGQN